jgi:hypothetical protein
MAAARVWEVRCSRHGSDWVFRCETRGVSRMAYPVFKDLQRLLKLNIELYEDFCDCAATSTETAYICALGGHLHMPWLSKHGHVISRGLAGRAFQHCQGAGCNAERSRKKRHGVARQATVLTAPNHNVTLSIWDLWLCCCEGRILAFGTKG